MVKVLTAILILCGTWISSLLYRRNNPLTCFSNSPHPVVSAHYAMQFLLHNSFTRVIDGHFYGVKTPSVGHLTQKQAPLNFKTRLSSMYLKAKAAGKSVIS